MLSYTGDQFAQVAIAILVYDCTRSAFLTALACTPPIVGCPLLYGLAEPSTSWPTRPSSPFSTHTRR